MDLEEAVKRKLELDKTRNQVRLELELKNKRNKSVFGRIKFFLLKPFKFLAWKLWGKKKEIARLKLLAGVRENEKKQKDLAASISQDVVKRLQELAGISNVHIVNTRQYDSYLDEPVNKPYKHRPGFSDEELNARLSSLPNPEKTLSEDDMHYRPEADLELLAAEIRIREKNPNSRSLGRERITAAVDFANGSTRPPVVDNSGLFPMLVVHNGDKK